MTFEEWRITAFTLRTALLTTLMIAPPGILLAWWMARRSWPGKSLVDTLLALPLVIPPVATGLILLELMGRRGPVGGFLHRVFEIDVVFTWRAVLVAGGVMAFPLLVRAARVGFEQAQEEMEDAAKVEGADALQVFWHVNLPLATRGIIAGLILAYARCLGEFGATILIAGNIPGRTTTIATAIYQHVQLGQDASAYRLLLVSVALAFVAIWTSEYFLRRRPD
ncbi:MAG: molybdate ABC transporter permease subunit [Kiritimatiellia bacterium]|jgi:molybdate transport system permease protein